MPKPHSEERLPARVVIGSRGLGYQDMLQEIANEFKAA